MKPALLRAAALLVVALSPVVAPARGTAGESLTATERLNQAGDETKDQYFTPADGASPKWLAKRYAYTRRP